MQDFDAWLSRELDRLFPIAEPGEAVLLYGQWRGIVQSKPFVRADEQLWVWVSVACGTQRVMIPLRHVCRLEDN